MKLVIDPDKLFLMKTSCLSKWTWFFVFVFSKLDVIVVFLD